MLRGGLLGLDGQGGGMLLAGPPLILRPGRQQRPRVRLGLQQPRHHQRHVHADPRRITLKPRELIGEDPVLLRFRFLPPQARPRQAHQFLCC
jgi:hypothetical protein